MNGDARTPALHELVGQARREGLLPDTGSIASGMEPRPWPVLLLTGLGAWMAVLPLLGVVGLLLGDLMQRGVGPYLVGVLMLGAAVVVLRADGVALFVEQLALPVLLVGLGSLGFGVFRDLPVAAAALVTGGLAFGLGVLIGRSWLALLLGALGGVLVGLALAERVDALLRRAGPDEAGPWVGRTGLMPWLTLHLLAGLWLVLAAGLRRHARPALQCRLDPLLTGWLLVLLGGVCVVAGRTFLIGAPVGAGWTAPGGWLQGRLSAWLMPLGSVLLTLLAAAHLARRWPALRRRWCLGVAAGLALLAAYLPVLGVAWLLLARALGQQRWRLAVAAALAAAWTIGSFYYQWAWPLADKALVLAGAAAVLGVMARAGWHEQRAAASMAPVTSAPTAAPATGLLLRRHRLGLGLSLLAVLLLVNIGIWQKEQLIRHGRPVLVELAPVDPRSLMQGDYMALNYRMAPELSQQLDGFDRLERPRVVLRLDGDGVATLLRLTDAAQPPGPGELVVELTPTQGRWVLVSDAWFFREGDGARWQAARYGEFRIDAAGRALLVGLADAQRRPIRP